MNLKDVIFGNSAAAVHDLGGSYSGSSQEWLPIKDILKGVIIGYGSPAAHATAHLSGRSRVSR